jgi:hypothetical protein
VIGLAGWGLYIVALYLAPLSLVQAVSAGGVGLLALLARAGGVRLAARERLGVTVSVAGLVLLALSLPAGVAHAARVTGGGPLAWIACSLVLAAVAALPAARVLRPGAGLAIAAGLLYSAGDVATKAAVGGISPVYLFALLLPACHGLAFVLLQLAFQRGTVLATAGVSSLLTNLLPIAAGFAVFGEQLPGGFAGALRSAGFAGAVAGGALLAGQGHDGERARGGGGGPGRPAGTRLPRPARRQPQGCGTARRQSDSARSASTSASSDWTIQAGRLLPRGSAEAAARRMMASRSGVSRGWV